MNAARRVRLSRIRPSPSMVVAGLALVLAATGSGYAAIQHSGAHAAKKKHKKKVKQGPAGAPGPQGLQGPAGPQGVPGAPGSGAVGDYFSATETGVSALTVPVGTSIPFPDDQASRGEAITRLDDRGWLIHEPGEYRVTFKIDTALNSALTLPTVSFHGIPTSISDQLSVPGTTLLGDGIIDVQEAQALRVTTRVQPVTLPAGTSASIVIERLGSGGSTLTEGRRSAPKLLARDAPDCPARSSGLPANRNPAASTTLVPAHPTGLSLCRYGRVRIHNGGKLLASGTVADKRALHRIRHAFVSLRPVPDGTINCPADFGTLILASFTYANAPADPVVIHTSGCASVSNGSLERAYYQSGKLDRLVRRGLG